MNLRVFTVYFKRFHSDDDLTHFYRSLRHMAYHSGSGATPYTQTTVMYKERHPTLVLRHKVLNISDQMSDEINNSTKGAHTSLAKFSETEIKTRIDSMSENFKIKFSSMMNDVAAEVKSMAPQEPIREKFAMEEEYQAAKQQYQQEWEAYVTFLATFDYIIIKFADLIVAILDLYRSFLEELFQITNSTNSPQDVVKKIETFNQVIKEELSKHVAIILEPLSKCAFF